MLCVCVCADAVAVVAASRRERNGVHSVEVDASESKDDDWKGERGGFGGESEG